MVKDAILEGGIGRLHSIIEIDPSMKSFDQYAVELFEKEVVSKEEAISACRDPEAFERIVTGISGMAGGLLG